MASFWITNSKGLAIASFIAGIFIDVDHFLDYYLNKGFSLDIIDFYRTCVNRKLTKIYIFFHSLELLIFFWLIAILYPSNLIWWGITIGVSQHLIFDGLVNELAPAGYFFAYRLIKKFDLKQFVKRREP